MKNLQNAYHHIFDSLYIDATGGLLEVVNYEPAFAKRELVEFQKYIKRVEKLIRITTQLEFFKDASLEEKCKITLDRMYDLETELRIKAFSKKNHSTANEDFVTQLAEKSKRAISISSINPN